MEKDPFDTPFFKNPEKHMKSTMKKMIIGAVLSSLVLAILVYSVTKSVGDSYNEGVAKIKENVGKKIIIEKDTFLIMDYSMLNKNYKLSNGQDIAFDLADKLKTIN